MRLFRGDRNEIAKYYRTEGILTRLLNGGDPSTVSRRGMFEALRAHISPEDINEKTFLQKTPFLSFTESRPKAESYAKGGAVGNLIPCEKQFGEDVVIFELNPGGMYNAGHEGVFVLSYSCDFSRVLPRIPGEDGVAQAASVSCEFCGSENQQELMKGGRALSHRIMLIRAASFLRGKRERQRYDGAQRKAESDQEWLIYPMDYVHRLRGFASRIPPSQIWTAHRYVFELGHPDAP